MAGERRGSVEEKSSWTYGYVQLDYSGLETAGPTGRKVLISVIALATIAAWRLRGQPDTVTGVRLSGGDYSGLETAGPTGHLALLDVHPDGL